MRVPDIAELWENVIEAFFPTLTEYRGPDSNASIHREWLRRSLDNDRSYRNRSKMRRHLRAVARPDGGDPYLEVWWYRLKQEHPRLRERPHKTQLWVGYIAHDRDLGEDAHMLRMRARHQLNRAVGYDLEQEIQPWVDYKEAA